MKRTLRRAGFVSLTLGAVSCGEPSQPEALQPNELFSSDTVTSDSRSGQGWRRFLAPKELHRAWAPAAVSPWRPYYKPTLVAAVESVASAAMPVRNVGMPPAEVEARRFASDYALGDTAVFIDLVGEQSVAWAATLRRAGLVPVLTINNWPHQFGILRLERPLGALLYYAEEMTQTPVDAFVAPPAFILERSRLAQKDLNPSSTQFDNRYYHAQTDFPTAEVFRARRISKIVYVNPRGIVAGCEEDDLNEYFSDLSKAGLEITYVRPRPEGFEAARVRPEPRTTIFTKPALAEYAASPGYRPHYYHSYYHYHVWHTTYWTRSTGAWGDGGYSSGGHSSGFSS